MMRHTEFSSVIVRLGKDEVLPSDVKQQRNGGDVRHMNIGGHEGAMGNRRAPSHRQKSEPEVKKEQHSTYNLAYEKSKTLFF
jgi:hypothetical protein